STPTTRPSTGRRRLRRPPRRLQWFWRRYVEGGERSSSLRRPTTREGNHYVRPLAALPAFAAQRRRDRSRQLPQRRVERGDLPAPTRLSRALARRVARGDRAHRGNGRIRLEHTQALRRLSQRPARTTQGAGR